MWCFFWVLVCEMFMVMWSIYILLRIGLSLFFRVGLGVVNVVNVEVEVVDFVVVFCGLCL